MKLDFLESVIALVGVGVVGGLFYLCYMIWLAAH